MIPQRCCSLLFVPFLCLLFSCTAKNYDSTGGDPYLAYLVETVKDEKLSTYAPLFLIEEPEENFNRIGRVKAHKGKDGKEVVYVDPKSSALYTSVRTFTTINEQYTNYMYRVHFPKIPMSLFPFYLGAGNNVGLLVVVTVNSQDQAVLYTLVHTCGCYLAFIPTSFLERWKYPDDWSLEDQYVYGERLPGLLQFEEGASQIVTLLIRSSTHRVKNIWLSRFPETARFQRVMPDLLDFGDLENIEISSGEYTSFFETEGTRYGYVKGSRKIWERLFISWWALDLRVGEDKKLGNDLEDGIVFYTSLKPWAREESDLRDFARFLKYWGWNL